MSVTLRVAKWPEEYQSTHISTEYEISDTETFDNILDSINGTVTNGKLEIAYSSIVVPEGKIYYARSKRYFQEGGDSGWIGPFPIHSVNNKNSTNTRPESTVEHPVVYANLQELLDESDDFTITTSNPRIKGPGSHVETHWYITDENEAVIYSSLYDNVNLLSLTISKNDIPFDGLEKLKIRAAHINNYGHQSEFGIKVLTLE